MYQCKIWLWSKSFFLPLSHCSLGYGVEYTHTSPRVYLWVTRRWCSFHCKCDILCRTTSSFQKQTLVCSGLVCVKHELMLQSPQCLSDIYYVIASVVDHYHIKSKQSSSWIYCSQMLHVEVVWSRKMTFFGKFIRWSSGWDLKPFPKCLILHQFLWKPSQMHQKLRRMFKRKSLHFGPALRTCHLSFICILRCALDVHHQKVPLSQIVCGCLCPLDS